jgi:predicted ATPase/class 3 adenylate cyclase
VSDLPTGTVTFLFTDLEGSTRLWEDHPEAMRVALASHDEIVRQAIEAHCGVVVKTTGDGFHAAFMTAAAALSAAQRAQRRLSAHPWAATGPLRVRMGLHTGEVDIRDGDYYGGAVNRAARLMSVAHGGQVVCSGATADLVRDGGGFELRDLGEHRLAGLARTERIWQLCSADLASEFPPLRSVPVRVGNLPRQLTSFVGREAEVQRVADLVRSHPLVTLTGVGGVGKTRLALEVAATVAPEFPDGAWFCELAPLVDPNAIWETIAATLQVLPTPGRSLDESILDALAPKHLLLVLDNCEHLLDAVARAVRSIAHACPGVGILATSREGLAEPGEQIVAVPSLPVPRSDAPREELLRMDAVMLFSERARSVRSDFTCDERTAAAVGVLCRRLDGIPLAIELAAARVRSLDPADIVQRLDQRFQLLTRGGRAARERHQTLRSTIDWSYDLLDARERTVLNRLSVFAGSCDLRGAEAVLGGDDLDTLDVVDALGHLVDKSLVLAEAEEDGGLRYRLLETIRQYAQERLEASGETAAVRRCHADHFVAVVEAAGPALRSPEQIACARALAREAENLRTALDWAGETASPDHALRLVAPLAIHGIAIGYTAGPWAEAAVQVPGAPEHPRYGDVTSWATWSAIARGDLPLAMRYAAMSEEAEARLGTGTAMACRGPATVAVFCGDFESARVESEKWAARSRRAGDGLELSQALTMLSLVQGATGMPALALETAEEALAIARDTGIPSALADALNLAPWSLLDEDPERALGLLDESIEVNTRLGDTHGVAMALSGKGVYYASEGDPDAALDQVREAIRLITQGGTVTGLIGGAAGVAAVALTNLGHDEEAALILGSSYRLAPAAYERPEQLRRDATAILVDRLGRSRYDELFAQGDGLIAAEALAVISTTLETVMTPG